MTPPTEKNKFVRVPESQAKNISGLYRRNNRFYFQTRVGYAASPVKIPLAAETIREAGKEIIQAKAKLLEGWRYQDAKWIEVGGVTTEASSGRSTEAKDNGSARLTDYSFDEVFSKWQEIKQSRVRESSRKCSEDDLEAWKGAFLKEGITSIRKVTRKDISEILDTWVRRQRGGGVCRRGPSRSWHVAACRRRVGEGSRRRVFQDHGYRRAEGVGRPRR